MFPGEILSSLDDGGNATFWWCGLGQRPNQVKNEKYVKKTKSWLNPLDCEPSGMITLV